MTAVDTAFNYQHFGSHRALAHAASELLDEFEVSTRVGFFPGLDGVRHLLDPARLREAIWRTVDDLGTPPAAILLHNPERTLTAVTPWHGHELLATACAVLAEATASGMCGQWGIASWEPGPVLAALRPGDGCPTPHVVMTRAGVTLDGRQLRETEQLAERFDVPAENRWGMSPFAGSTRHPVWTQTDLSAFFEREGNGEDDGPTTVQAAFRLAFELPAVTRIAVGAGSADHLRQLIDAIHLRVRPGQLIRYRQLVDAAPIPEASPT
ncbi:hypothetical protein ACQPW3_34795 [Actinosynnema sp. CA-248983]